jgi:hypothetical protein
MTETIGATSMVMLVIRAELARQPYSIQHERAKAQRFIR